MAGAGLKEIPEQWVQALTAALSGDGALLPEAVAAVSRIKPGKQHAGRFREPLLNVAARGDLPAAVRLEALAAVPGGPVELAPDLFRFVVTQLASDVPAPQRLAAAQALGQARLGRGQLLDLTTAVGSAGPLEIDRLLAAFDQTDDREVGERLVAALKAGKGVRGLRADALRARLTRFGPDVLKQAEPLLADLNPDAAKQKAHVEELLASLPKGDVRRGQAVFNSPRAACVSCHAIGYVGGNVGPDLTRVGQARAERDLLESVVYPSASIVQSFEPVVVVTTDGDVQSGIVRRNDADEVVLVTGPQQEVRIPRARVKEIRPSAVSVMPEGLEQQLSRQELADLLAFLKANK
jgi:putative heme-binding domain-containing protein